MKPFEALSTGGRGWRIVVDELVVETRVGLYEHEYRAPQPVAIDASLIYRGAPDEACSHLLDYEAWCERVSAYLTAKPHTRLLEMLALEIAALSFEAFPALDAITLLLYKPKIREGTRRLGIELDWRRADFEAWSMRERSRHAVDAH
ncbi:MULTISPECIES: dihydroneopterin aldolase [unclassified Caballeronia]|uniref:dihydroneopterin aldolase n=1 Tax=unclassified Caballeronia TaxID=2646786 RepID=UPI00285A1A39|nr:MULTISPECIES: dihydroneopterin aldolase [unclassified Caballeronia]MDR5754429.1 dihydroneopterin aldolase [Caballeronia sp. LZ024]MDR5840807.1 dihydroneopterin aldolase [Caballeronia sp. LZ031]